jgi:hypothetical protein
MLSLVSLCSAVFQSSTASANEIFSSMFQSNLDPPLNTKSVHNYVIELLRKFGNFWGPGFYVMKFCSYLPDLPPSARIDVI